MPRFAAIGLDHRHIYDLTQDLLDAGAECVGYNPDTTDPRVLAGFRKRFPHVPAFETKQLLEDPSIDFVVIAARPCDRAELAVAAMQRGKDVMVDKPGVTTSEQLAAVERAVRETGRIWSICLGRLASPAVQEALRIVRSGELGRLVHTTSLAPHRLNRDAAAGVVLRYAGVWRHHQRYRRALDRSVSGLRRGRRCRGRVVQHWRVRHRTSGLRGFRRAGAGDAVGARLHPARLVHAGRPADLGGRSLLRRRHRRHAGAAQEPRHRGPRRAPTICSSPTA